MTTRSLTRIEQAAQELVGAEQVAPTLWQEDGLHPPALDIVNVVQQLICTSGCEPLMGEVPEAILTELIARPRSAQELLNLLSSKQ